MLQVQLKQAVETLPFVVVKRSPKKARKRFTRQMREKMQTLDGMKKFVDFMIISVRDFDYTREQIAHRLRVICR